MALSEIDRHLLQRCLGRKPRAWEDFVDRFMGLVVHVINHTAQARSMRLSPADREDLCADVFLAIVRDDFAVLRNFRGQSSLATYLTVVARRVVVRKLMKRKNAARLAELAREHSEQSGAVPVDSDVMDPASDQPQRWQEDREEVERLLQQLEPEEARFVRLFHLEGKSYQEISHETGVASNTIGPILSRAREKLRDLGLAANWAVS